jgi:hypothetical protein
MLPTLAERMREQQARTRSRPPSRQPWPLPTDPPTALLFQPLPQAPDPVVAAAVEPAAPTAPPTRSAQAEVLLLGVWAVLVVMDGVLALASLIHGLVPRERRNPWELHQKRATLAASSAGLSDPAGNTEAPGLLQRCRSLAPSL